MKKRMNVAHQPQQFNTLSFTLRGGRIANPERSAPRLTKSALVAIHHTK
jgi:hypothetical protein